MNQTTHVSDSGLPSLFGMGLDQLQQLCADEGMPRFAAKQMCDWLYAKHVDSIDAMTNLSLKATKDIRITDSFRIPILGQIVANPCAQKAYLVLGITLHS